MVQMYCTKPDLEESELMEVRRTLLQWNPTWWSVLSWPSGVHPCLRARVPPNYFRTKMAAMTGVHESLSSISPQYLTRGIMT